MAEEAQAPGQENLDSLTSNGKSAPTEVQIFQTIREGRHQEVLELVQDRPSLWNEAEQDGKHTLLHWAALAGNIPLVEHAISSSAEVNLASENGQTPLMWAMIKGRVEVGHKLLKAKADPHAKDSLGATSLILAVQHQQHSCVLLLLAHAGPSELLRARDAKGCVALHWAAYKGDEQAVKMLAYFKADFSVVDAEQMTPIHRAVQNGKDLICEVLMDNKVDPSALDNKGRNCLDVAREAESYGVLNRLGRMLKEHDAAASTVAVADEEADAGAARRGRRLQRLQKQEMDRWREKAQLNGPATFWLVCVSLASFQYLTDLRVESWELAPTAALAFELGIVTSLALFFSVMFADPGKVPSRHCAVEDLLKSLRDPPDGEMPDLSRLCTTTWVVKGLRTKYCSHTGACVEEFDHFCGWINVAIGKGNHRRFIFLAACEVLSQILHLYLCVQVARHLVSADTYTEWFYNAGILFLLANHIYLIVVNLTTNEVINAHRYTHFWKEDKITKRKVWNNPFNKGDPLRNCLDFWWFRRRSELGNASS
eukprot:TRINITY_DN3723_c0_g2_i2.p1 TRINITY_DN3723_c0_g2~~TRINITY_DN3723_c0_g2_i2.p1  ORF type:complete len:569 (-),score=96.13 TRINITY_DN3723_c0_g2_i2:66-1682(-)